MPSSIILPMVFGDMVMAGAALGATGLAVTSFAINVVSTMAISSLLNRNTAAPPTAGQQGGVVQLQPQTSNKLPVVYGEAWVSPTIVDVKMSTDQQTMWYVLAFCEATDTGTITFDEVYWDDKILLFDTSDASHVRAWYNTQDDTTVTGPGNTDAIRMWFYSNGSHQGTTHHCVNQDGTSQELDNPGNVSAISVLQDSGILAENRWTNTDLMSNTVFAVLKLRYDQAHSIQNIGQIKAKIYNDLGTGQNPDGSNNTALGTGAVIYDYLTNTRYGCGVDPVFIDVGSLTELSNYSADPEFNLSNGLGGLDGVGFRYQLNGMVDTTKDCLTNLVTLAENCDSWIQWNEAAGVWGVLINRSYEEAGLLDNQLRSITSDNIIGGIGITPLDLNSTYNSVQVQFPNQYFIDAQGNPLPDRYKGQPDFRTYDLESNQRFANEPDNKVTLSFPFVTNSIQATYLAYKRLWQSREDLIINFTTDYSGIQIDAGDVIRITHEWYGWSDKLFRVTQVKESKAQDGSLTAQIAATSYNPLVYSTTNPHYFSISSFSGLGDPAYISTPPAPTIPDTKVISTAGTFVIQGEIPAQGNVSSMEFWYARNGAALAANNYVLYETQHYNDAQYYPLTDATGATFYEQAQAIDLPTDTYYWRTRAVGPNSKSQFSEASAPIVWDNKKKAITGTQIDDHTISGSKVVTGDPQTTGGAQSKGFFDTIGPIAGIGLAATAGYYLYKHPELYTATKDGTPNIGGGNDSGTEPTDPSVTSTVDTEGGTITHVIDMGKNVVNNIEEAASTAVTSVGNFLSGFFGSNEE